MSLYVLSFFCFSSAHCPDNHVLVFVFRESELPALGTLRKTRRKRQRERHQTKDLMSKTMAVHVRYKSLYISLPSSAKQ